MSKAMLDLKQDIDISKSHKFRVTNRMEKYLKIKKNIGSILADDSGKTVDILKPHGGWQWATVAEGYVKNSLNNKKSIAVYCLNNYKFIY